MCCGLHSWPVLDAQRARPAIVVGTDDGRSGRLASEMVVGVLRASNARLRAR
jgi:hypothetical protein